MENLQKAIEKARTSRAQKSGSTRMAVHTSVAGDSAWDTLIAANPDRAHLKSKRVATLDGNKAGSHYDMLRTRIRDMAQKDGLRRIAIVSAGPQVGKTTTLVNLAFSFGRLPYEKTMVFDFDLRRPSLQSIIGMTPAATMGDVLRGQVPFEEHARRVGNNLAFAVNSGPVEHPSELLQSGNMTDFLKDIEGRYQPDLMFFDTPPLLAADDTRGFLSNVDAALLVVEAERTPADQIDVVEQQLSELTNVLGVVLNKCNYPDPATTASYGYY
ncbi:tyrosine-protein kinase family protein [Celeribacter sp.]|uniref:tyrosine-protein kinase family protein n=1 Tax=Celeribacter sp. TaxID=1890673 RepID=UPI003A8CD066